jgi:DNA-binding FadR family transcriptional regulator
MRAAGRIDAATLETLEENLRLTEEAHAAGRSIIDLDLEFHTTIAEAAGNRALLLAREPISQLFYPALETLFAHPLNTTGPQRLIDAHRRILDALKVRDAETAEAWMRRHIVDFRRGYAQCGFNLGEVVGYDAGRPAARPRR